MSEAEEIRAAIEARFEALRGALRIQRERRLWLEVGYPEFRPVFDFVAGDLGFGQLATISGTDEGSDLGFIYHLARESGTVLSLMTRAAKGEAVASVGDRFPGALIYERELVDLFGAQITGLPEGPRYPLPDDWPPSEHPLLKSWQPRGAAAPASEGAGAGGPDASEGTDEEAGDA